MISRRGFFGVMAGSTALVATAVGANVEKEPAFPGWVIRWSGWKEPVNQFVKFGFWWARRDPMPAAIAPGDWPCCYSSTLGVTAVSRDLYVVDTSWHAKSAPILPSEPPARFEAAKAQALQRLIEKLESL